MLFGWCFSQSDIQSIRLSRRQSPRSNVGLRALLKRPTAVRISSTLQVPVMYLNHYNKILDKSDRQITCNVITLSSNQNDHYTIVLKPLLKLNRIFSIFSTKAKSPCDLGGATWYWAWDWKGWITTADKFTVKWHCSVSPVEGGSL